MAMLAAVPGWSRGGVVRAVLSRYGGGQLGATWADAAPYADLSGVTVEQLYSLREDLAATIRQALGAGR